MNKDIEILKTFPIGVIVESTIGKGGPSVWVFDDKWEEGYRFDSHTSNEYCFISPDLANSPEQALDILDKIFDYIPKIKSTSKTCSSSEQLYKDLVLIKWRK